MTSQMKNALFSGSASLPMKRPASHTMVKGDILPACVDYQNDLAMLLERKKNGGAYDTALEEYLLNNISKLSACLLKKLDAVESALLASKKERDILAQATFYRDALFSAMSELRLIVDELETLIARKHWPLPTYAKLLYSIN